MPAATTRRAIAVPVRRATSSGTQRITTGIPGLDQLMQGGFVRNSVNLVTGGTGTGKTIFAGQFLWEGLQKGEPCVYITMEQHPDDLKQDFLQFGWNFDKYEKQGLCSIEYFDPAQVNNIASAILNSVKTLRAKRLAVDSTSVVGLTIENEMMIRRKLLSLVDAVKRQSGDCTTLITTEIVEDSKGLSRWGVEEFVVDGVVVLQFTGIGGESFGNLQVRKMRRTPHARGWFPLEITSSGLKVSKDEVSVLMK